MKANNVYNHTKVTESDKGGKIKNQQSSALHDKNPKTNHDARTPSQMKQKPVPDQNHKGFQCDTNPMNEDSFEKACIMREKKERDIARERYIAGIQGRDGGKKPYESSNINN